jgi:PHD/YefM family antitoxin component YafN of YafNO toxin-antitoxin module
MSKTIPVTSLRKDLFQTINNVHISGEPLIVEKGGIPLVVIYSVKNFSDESTYKTDSIEGALSTSTLNETRGAWKYDDDWDSKSKQRDKLEKAIASKLKALW